MLFLPSFFFRWRLGKFIVTLMAVWLFVFLQAALPASGQPVSPGQVKAAFIYNFAKFVEWPPGTFTDQRAAITLCILKDEPLAAAVMALQGKEVQGRKIVVKQGLSIEEMKRCQIFFASASQKPGLIEIMRVLRAYPILTVTDEVDDFAKLGVIINLTRQEDKVRFAICNDNAGTCGLKISSQLLKLAILASR
jgi:hypothetical protein